MSRCGLPGTSAEVSLNVIIVSGGRDAVAVDPALDALFPLLQAARASAPAPPARNERRDIGEGTRSNLSSPDGG